MTFAPSFASRLNSFAARPDLYWEANHGKLTTLQLIERAARVPGLTQIDLNYPDHVQGFSPQSLREILQGHNLTLNGFEMRYYSDPSFNLGAFTNPNPEIREKAIALTCEGIDMMVASGGKLMNIWLGQDGFDYAFQADYARLWQQEVDALRRVALHNPSIQISIEYKPNDPRAFSLLNDIGTTLLAIRETGLPNLGVAIDFCHTLIADEQPAYSAVLAVLQSQLLGIHLNDGYGQRDDGLMAGSIHTLQTLELLYYLQQVNYQGIIYFDTFPQNEDPIAECAANIVTVKRMLALLEMLDEAEFSSILHQQDALAAQEKLQGLLLQTVRSNGKSNGGNNRR